MLDVALKFIVQELNAYLLARTALNFGTAELSAIVDDGGKWKAKLDQLGCFLVGVDEERITKEHLPSIEYRNGQHVKLQPPIKLHLNVLFFAHFTNYDQSLKYLSHVLKFFQRYSYFTSELHPGMPEGIDRLVVELQSPTYEQLNQIWAFIGSKYLPSALYRIRMTVIQDDQPDDITPPLSEVSVEYATP